MAAPSNNTGLSKFIADQVWMGNGKISDKMSDADKFKMLGKLNGRVVELVTPDGVELPAIWSEADCPTTRTVIVWHGAGNCLWGKWFLGHVAHWYHERGMNVMSATYRGYDGGAGDAAADGETGIIHDTQAVVNEVLRFGIPPEDILAHGVSIGSLYATTAFTLNGLGALNIDHGIDDTSRVLGRVVGAHWIMNSINFVTRGAVQKMLPSTFEEDDAIYALYGMSNVNRLKFSSTQFSPDSVFISYGKKDSWMPLKAQQRLAQAAGMEELDPTAPNICMVNGNHFVNGNLPTWDDRDADNKYYAWLADRGFVTLTFQGGE